MADGRRPSLLACRGSPPFSPTTTVTLHATIGPCSSHACFVACRGSAAEPALTTDINSVLDDKKGNLWIASDGEGLIRYRAGEWRVYEGKKEIPIDRVHMVTQDVSGAIWLGTGGAGIVRFQNDVFTTYNMTDGSRRPRP
jgi:ligand-binding sensor domain-containing protein